MKKSKQFILMILVFTFSLIFLLTSCDSKASFTTNDGYLSLKFPKNFLFGENSTDTSDTYSFALDEQNFIIISTEKMNDVDPTKLDVSILKQNAKVYSEPFVKQGFTMEYEETTNMGDNDAYKAVYADKEFTVGYIQWFETDATPVTLYKLMYVHNNENASTIESVVNSIKIKK